MAMRSYLYSADTLPTDTEIPDKVLGISEHNWDIPLAHLLLTGRDPRVVPSMIWSAPVGIGADFDGGADLRNRLGADLSLAATARAGTCQIQDRNGFVR